MLGKLLKNEWKATWKLPCLVCVFVCVLTLIGSFSFRMPIWQKLAEDNMASFDVFDLSSVMFLFTYILAVIASAYAVMIYFAFRFYKNLYTDEGYLMHTLPVTPRQLIVSKCLVSVLWTFLSSVLIVCSLFFLLYIWLRTLLSDQDWNMVREAINIYLPQIAEAFRQQSGFSIVIWPVSFAGVAVLGSVSGMLMIYASVSIGQLFRRHKVAASVLTYLVITSIVQLLTSIVVMPLTFSMMMKMSRIQPTSVIESLAAPLAYTVSTFFLSLILYIISAVGFYIATEYIMKRRLNLD